ncbi:DUF4190 domain-containing protein [Arthrobacter rhombi]|uniref:DUF4190 domain-containing protein n=1 Tax=Arthrobacter rhombi TaxID=71253 RepID=UPI003FD09ADB
MGGLQGWHILILGVIALVAIMVVGLVLVIVLKSSNRPRAGVAANFNAGQPQGVPTQIGYTMNGQPMYQQPVLPQTNLFSILALVLGIFTGILGIIFGHIARSQIRQTGEGGAGLALSGLIIGYVWVGLFLLRMIF